jgi:hypothetical protein
MHKENASAFADVVSKFSWFKNKKFRFFVVTLPYTVIGIVFAFLEVWYCRTPWCVIKSATKKMEGLSGGMDFVNSVLLGNAVLVVIVSAIFFLFKDSLLDFGKLKDISEHIEQTVLDIVGSTINAHKEKGYPATFVAASKSDFMDLKLANNTLGAFSKRTYQLAYMLIFLSTAWAILDFPLKIIPRTASAWNEERLILGMFLSSLTIITISVYGMLFIPIKLLRGNVRGSLQENNIRKKYSQFVQESEESSTEQTVREAIHRIDKIFPPS